MMHDPIGPGTSTWEAFDKTIDAWHAFVITGQKTRINGRVNPLYHRYTNCRQYTLSLVAKHNGDVKAWKKSIKDSCNNS